MKTGTFTIKEVEFIRANCDQMNDHQIGKKLNRSNSSIKNYRARNGLLRPKVEREGLPANRRITLTLELAKALHANCNIPEILSRIEIKFPEIIKPLKSE